MEAAETRDVSRRFRLVTGVWRGIFIVLTCAGFALSVNEIFNLQFLLGIVVLKNSYLYLLLGVFLSVIFIIFPASSGKSKSSVPWYDVILFGISLSVSIYFSVTGPQSLREGWEYASPTLPSALGIVLWGIVLEAARRTGGWSIFFVFSILSAYPIFAGSSFMPSLVSGQEQDFISTARYHLLSEESVLGIPMSVFGSLIIGFIIFGVTLSSTGGGRFFINLAFATLGGVRGGPAKVAIVASGLFGSLSGSVITNVLTTGPMTIPAMIRTGYPKRYAGGIEACASTGGVLMPPVMGATAFVMASFLGVPYGTIAIAAIVPSFLYFFGLFVQIDAYAARFDLKGLPSEELPSALATVKSGWYYIFAFFFLVYLLLYLGREAQSPFYATATLLALSQLGKLSRSDPWFYVIGIATSFFIVLSIFSTRLPADLVTKIPVAAGFLLLLISNLPKHIRVSLNDVTSYIETNGRLLAELVGTLAAVGLIIGGVMVTGMAGSFSGDLVRLAGGNVYLMLLLGALTSFVLGIGMTVTAAYIFLAIVLAPALIDLGLDKVSVHLFILYWGMISFITPPVALGAFAAATLSGSKPMSTGLQAMRLGSIIYFLPFFFVLNPALILNGEFIEVFPEVLSAVLGTVLIAASLQGFLVFFGSLTHGLGGPLVRSMLLLAGLLLAYPETTSNIAGLALMLTSLIFARLTSSSLNDQKGKSHG
ncbi:TRAP transporter fused permease subunit [Sulfitobacter sp. KE34]|nr:TRAP transporter fused permease subunit [Sulfitobacter sp. KE12]MDF3355630.1 TRAP transporter fused permease subunit [Sulfitobacter sp. KE27]MDF3359316.1 TRAP transporter fused permease subunit [Sulfitobacter sp. KE33]MDF3366737.1 TRAP transporter fused permease subunit [Sulfitobacter sp. Ks34]MDF3373940.1 TRAP transporter fused permease subunit [Sulfitobacter sp. KS8]MDF3377582.1 TRAP transporter fused permease subunit [Sulfitobacter sp. KE37]MDF3381297.1 TRAP transporter fused permease s